MAADASSLKGSTWLAVQYSAASSAGTSSLSLARALPGGSMG